MNASYYHVCNECTAKWFGPLPRLVCPRCCRPSHSNEQLDPPWTEQRIPPARLLKELFEQQRSDTDALRARIANHEKRFKVCALIVLSIVVLNLSLLALLFV